MTHVFVFFFLLVCLFIFTTQCNVATTSIMVSILSLVKT